jgi:hypothetical protein
LQGVIEAQRWKLLQKDFRQDLGRMFDPGLAAGFSLKACHLHVGDSAWRNVTE